MQVVGTLVEKIDTADNYSAEALGVMTGLLVIKAATTKNYCYLKRLTGHCDNMGIVKHGNIANKAVPEKQVQADLIALIKKVIGELPRKFDYKHVYGHLDKILQWDQLTIVQ